MRATRLVALPSLLLLWTSALPGQDRYPVRQLTVHPAQEGFPTWSPDGKLLAYELIGRDADSVLTGLWMIPADGGEPRRALDVIAEHPDWSPDGHYIVFDADSGNRMNLVAARGGSPIRLAPSLHIVRGGNPRWSPDGGRILFKEGARLMVMDVRSGEARAVFQRDGTQPIMASWSRDGAAIYFVLREADSPSSSLWWAPLAAGDPRQIAPASDRAYRYPAVSPDGTLLAFAWCEGRACDLWIMPSAGGRPVQLTTHPAYDDTPRWSPDGTRIAFTSTRSGGFDIWLMTLDLDDLRGAVASAQQEAP